MTKAKGAIKDGQTITMMPAAGWFNVKLLIATGGQALISKLVGSRTARREILAALDEVKRENDSSGFTKEGYYDASKSAGLQQSDDLWVDYIADIGDGFDATYSMAWLIGRDYLFLDKVGKKIPQPIPAYSNSEANKDTVKVDHALPAGQVTIFGGDEVYPYATSKNYFHRTTTPYMLARPWSSAFPKHDDYTGVRALFALPGNHDWYDGLSSFIRNFCQPGRWIGCWKVSQRRSYFSIKLSNGFWIWGLDTATADDIDAPQLEYFKRQAKCLEKNDQVILCVPKPAWVDFPDAEPGKIHGEPHSWTAWHKISLIESLVTHNKNGGGRVPVILSGDLHHYSRYQAGSVIGNDAKHYITSGGGGAFMSGTNFLPQTLDMPERKRAQQKIAFPSSVTSKKYRKAVFKMVFVHKLICLLIGAFMLKSIWLLNTSGQFLEKATESIDLPTDVLSTTLVEKFLGVFTSLNGLQVFFHHLYLLFIYQPLTLAIPIVIFTAFIAFANSGASYKTPKWGVPVFGVLHGGLHIIAAFTIASSLLALFNYLDVPTVAKLFAFPTIGLLLAWLVNGTIFAGYLLISNLLVSLHNQEIYSAQSIVNWKGFLRLRVNKDGLTIFPVGVPKVSREWEQAPHPKDKKKSLIKPRRLQNIYTRKIHVTIPKGTTHVFQPKKPIDITLIETPIFIPIIKNMDVGDENA